MWRIARAALNNDYMRLGPADDLYAIRLFPTPAKEGGQTKGWWSRFCCWFWKAREVKLETLYPARRQRGVVGVVEGVLLGVEIGKRDEQIAKKNMRMDRSPEETSATKILTALRRPHLVQSRWWNRPQEAGLPRKYMRCLPRKYQSPESAPTSSQLLGVETTRV